MVCLNLFLSSLKISVNLLLYNANVSWSFIYYDNQFTLEKQQKIKSKVKSKKYKMKANESK